MPFSRKDGLLESRAALAHASTSGKGTEGVHDPAGRVGPPLLPAGASHDRRGIDIKLKGRALGRWLRPEPGTLREDAVAGLPGVIASVPDGMRTAVLVGVNPVYGLYASFAAVHDAIRRGPGLCSDGT